MKKFTLLQLFSIVDGRLSANIGDVYEMLNQYTGQSLMTHHLPVAMDYLKSKSPDWFMKAQVDIDTFKSLVPKNDSKVSDFNELMKLIEAYTETYDILPIDESEQVEFGGYMVKNSLLLR